MSNLTYNSPSNKRIVSLMEKYEKMQNHLHPGPTYFHIKDDYHRMVGGGRVLPGTSGHYQPAHLDEMSVRSYYPVEQRLFNEIRKPIGLPKPVGAGRSGGKMKLTKQIEELGEYAKPVLKPILDAATKKIVRKIGKGRSGGRMSGGEMSAGRMSGGEMSAGRMSGGAKSARGALVSKLMKEKGMTLPEASRHIKENGLKF